MLLTPKYSFQLLLIESVNKVENTYCEVVHLFSLGV